MILKDNDAMARLNSPNNLINRLRDLKSNRGAAMGLFGLSNGSKKNKIEEVTIENKKESREENKIENKIEFKEPIVVPIFSNPFLKQDRLQLTESIHVVSEDSAKQPSIDNLLHNSDVQIRLATAHDNALEVLTRTINMMKDKLDDVKADKLPAVITATSKVVESIRKERNEQAKNSKGRDVHYHFYTPNQKKVSDYEVIEVS